jgi:hypothetical protein
VTQKNAAPKPIGAAKRISKPITTNGSAPGPRPRASSAGDDHTSDDHTNDDRTSDANRPASHCFGQR